MSHRIALTAAITLLTAGYVSAQEKLSEAQVRRIVQQEIQKSLQRTDPQTRKVQATQVFLPPGVRTDRRYTGVPYGLIPSPFGQPRNSVKKALDAAERAIEADKSLSKKQRVQALKGLEKIRQVVSSAAKKTAGEGRRGKGRGAKGKRRKARGAGRRGKAGKARRNKANKAAGKKAAGKKRKAGKRRNKNKKNNAPTLTVPQVTYGWSTKAPTLGFFPKEGKPFPVLQAAPGKKPTLHWTFPTKNKPVLLPRPNLELLWKKAKDTKKPAAKKKPATTKRKRRDL